MPEHTLHAEVLTPEGKVFEGDVQQLSTRTAVGEIGILANHVPVLARLRPTVLRLHKSDSEVERYAQGEGWLQVFANRAMVLVGECVPPDQLDRGVLEQRAKDAEQRMGEAEEGSAAYERAERDKDRAEAFLNVAGSSR
ncbi:MAG TPA: ATP synthase F1 subunit epsilon [Solirubrobacterales bacterium]|jgi:F-type H+-transporting ATPase subunit epsilon|nr:ATP synthase F1 subunit epsilon [Solirubrobacterales bacterium]